MPLSAPPHPQPHAHHAFPPLPAPTIHDVLIQSASRSPRANAIETLDGATVTYGELLERSRRFASALASLGVRKGDRVGVMLPNLPEFLSAWFGGLMAGAVVVPLNVMLTPREIEHVIGDSGAVALLYLDRYAPQVAEGTRGVECLRERIVLRREPAAAAPGATPTAPEATIHNHDELLAAADPNFAPVPVELFDLSLLVYTSGTTGRPKGAMLSHGNIVSNLATLTAARPAGESARALCALPLFHCFGLVAVMNVTILRGGTCLLLPRFDAAAVVDLLANRAITTFSGTPTMFFHVLNHPSSRNAEFPTLMRAGSGGAPLPLEIRKEWGERFQPEISEGYGLSEASVSLCGYSLGLPIKAGSVGCPWPGIEMSVMNDDGTEAMLGEIGEIVARGPTIMVGYWNNREATADTIRDGWLHTGDLGTMDDKGYFTIVDRKKDLIIKGGFNIYPRELEEVLYELPEVNMAAVVGLPDAAKGERVEAAVSLKPGRELTPEAIMAHLEKRLARYKLPSSVRVLKELPVGPTGKILKREIKARWNEIEG